MATRKPSKKKTSQGHPARRDGASSVPFETEVRQALQPFKQGLHRHFQQESSSETRSALEGLTTLLTVHAQLRKEVNITSFDTAALGEQLGHLRSLGEDVLRTSANLLKQYLVFLGQSANFGGSVEDFKSSFEFLSKMAGDSPIVVPFMEDDEANAAFEQLPMVFAARELLAWVGAGQPTDPSGVLHGQTLAQAAEALGMLIKVEESADAGATAWEPADGSIVGSLAEVPRLAAYWDALIGTALLRYETPNAVPTDNLLQALNSTTGAGSRLIKELIAEVLFSHVLTHALAVPGQGHVAEMVAGVLSNAASSNQPRTDFALQTPGIEDLPEEQHHLLPQLQATVPQVERVLRCFEREGLVTIGEYISVPEVVRVSLERALEKVSDRLLAGQAGDEA
ncbi:hypothetical protein OK351_10040 [Glutamicibacter sp. MNS18]|uniref:hypothetical protein n=1 Tax=Glutamicibacter sp. MNS18 TaxID=2989817 RepID=UPI002236830E|nr:hypothetical protein [Glutamicibacter sp. MNS18]MCW4465844.1 hypothetical protein [Glutamicibacter sp. MNS18]